MQSELKITGKSLLSLSDLSDQDMIAVLDLAEELKPSTYAKLFNSLDAFRRPERFQQWLLACEADSRGRLGHEDSQPEQTAIIQRAFDAAANVDTSEIVNQGLEGSAIADEIARLRRQAIAEALR